MDELHDRMPVILDEPDWPVWLGETEGGSHRVGSPRNNGPELLVELVAGGGQGA